MTEPLPSGSKLPERIASTSGHGLKGPYGTVLGAMVAPLSYLSHANSRSEYPNNPGEAGNMEQDHPFWRTRHTSSSEPWDYEYSGPPGFLVLLRKALTWITEDIANSTRHVHDAHVDPCKDSGIPNALKVPEPIHKPDRQLFETTRKKQAYREIRILKEMVPIEIFKACKSTPRKLVRRRATTGKKLKNLAQNGSLHMSSRLYPEASGLSTTRCKLMLPYLYQVGSHNKATRTSDPRSSKDMCKGFKASFLDLVDGGISQLPGGLIYTDTTLFALLDTQGWGSGNAAKRDTTAAKKR